jgi:anti-sigma factor RsiW
MLSAHISDRELVLELDGELELERAVQVRAHLKSCAACRDRSAGLAAASVDFAAVSEAVAAPRAGSRRRWVALGAAAMVAVVAVPALLLTSARSIGGQLPDAALTPGATVPVSVEALCAAPEPDAPPIDPRLAAVVFARYGVDPEPRAYELDHLITPALGGSSEAGNLWPQPYRAGEWNSRVKDALEDRLRSLVCAGKLDLAAAQHELAADWIAAYCKRFGTAQPLSEHAAFVKDRAWE